MSFIKYLLEQQVENEIDAESQLQVPGIGVMSTQHAIKRTVDMIDDIARRIQVPHPDWYMIKSLLANDALHAYLQALITAQQTPAPEQTPVQ